MAIGEITKKDLREFVKRHTSGLSSLEGEDGCEKALDDAAENLRYALDDGLTHGDIKVGGGHVSFDDSDGEYLLYTMDSVTKGKIQFTSFQ